VDGRHGFKLTELLEPAKYGMARVTLLVEEVVRIRIVEKGKDL